MFPKNFSNLSYSCSLVYLCSSGCNSSSDKNNSSSLSYSFFFPVVFKAILKKNIIILLIIIVVLWGWDKFYRLLLLFLVLQLFSFGFHILPFLWRNLFLFLWRKERLPLINFWHLLEFLRRFLDHFYLRIILLLWLHFYLILIYPNLRNLIKSPFISILLFNLFPVYYPFLSNIYSKK